MRTRRPTTLALPLLLTGLLPLACSSAAPEQDAALERLDAGRDALPPADDALPDGPLADTAPPTPRLAFLSTEGAEVTELRYGDAFVVRATGLPADAEVTLRAQLWSYHSEAVFRSDAEGTIDLSRDAPLRGSYGGVDPDGPIWSMTRETTDTGDTFDVDFAVEDATGAVLATATLRRTPLGTGMQITQLDSDGLVGVLYAPTTAGPHPAVLVLGGSDGGVPSFSAAYIASLGYVALALAYFGAPGLPQSLTDIPVEYFDKGVAWLAARAEVDPDHLGVAGGSRGGELALLLGSRIPQLRGVFADVPSGVLWGSAGVRDAAAWTAEGKPLPYIPSAANTQPLEEILPSGKPGYRLTPTFLADLAAADPATLEAATIPIEQASGQVVLVAGQDDGLWPSCPLAQIAMDRLTASGHAAQHGDALHCFVDAGHSIGAPGWPTRESYAIYAYNMVMILGGTPAGTARAQRERDALLRAWLAQL